MVSPKQLLSTIESALLGPSPPSPYERIELMHAIRSSLPSLQSFLSYPGPKASDRSQVQSKEVRLQDSPPISLDDLDVELALKLSDDLNLNEIECVRLLISANQEWLLFGREPLEIYRLAAGLWYIERRDLITSLYTLLRAVVLDPGMEADLVAEIQKHLEALFNSGLRKRLITLIKELNREEPAGFGGPLSERYVLDCRGALVERKAVLCRERLSLGHCLVLSELIVRMSPTDVKDVFFTLKDCAAEINETEDTLKLQIIYSLLFSLVVAFMSDALSTVHDKASVLSHDASFILEFRDLVMANGGDPDFAGFVDVIRLAWTVHLMLTQDQSIERVTISGSSSRNMANIHSCLEVICSNNVFLFLRSRILRAAAYQNDDEDMIYMYNAYMHKLITCFLSHPLARDKVKEMKEKAMSASPYLMAGADDLGDENNVTSQHYVDIKNQPFVSLMDLVTEIYQKEPELLNGNEDLWTFINFAGEDHTNIPTLVAFLRLLSTLATTEEGASKVFELLQGKTFRSIGWNTLFDCISIYEQKFKKSVQSPGAMLPDFQDGDAQALVAYLNVLQKVVENGNPTERKKWFPDIESLFKLLSYENVPPYLKGALRNAIAAFIQVSPLMKDTIWSYLEQYDLPVVIGHPVGSSLQQIPAQVYDMRFELDEVEARQERYPSTISFLNLLNALIAKEKDINDRGRRFMGIFRFVYDHVFGPFPQRAYADPSEKWQLVVACLQHFRMILSMYDVKDEDVDNAVDLSQLPTKANASPIEMQFPVLELLKDFMSNRTVFRNIMSILLLGVNNVIQDRSCQIYGQLLEKAVLLSLEVITLVFERDLFLADFWRPLYQPLDVILSQDHNQIVALLEYVRYDSLPQIQLCSIKIMNILSSRMLGLVQLLLKSNAAKYLVEDYASCLQLRFEECQIIENTKDDSGILIMQLLIDNIGRPAPNVTHLLLKFDVDTPVEQTVLQPKYHYSCLRVILDSLEKLSKANTNALLHEFGFQLLYELCMDPLTGGPTMDLLSTKKYHFFSKHLETIGVAPLPKRTNTQAFRISSLHQRAWLLKLLALELHVADMASSGHREACLAILSKIFDRGSTEYITGSNVSKTSPTDGNHVGVFVNKSKVLQLLEVVQFKSPDTAMDYSHFVSNSKYNLKVEDILKNSATSENGGVYYYSERGDRLIDLAAFHDKLWQTCNFLNPQLISLGNEVELGNIREFIQYLLRWGWKYNKNLEEQAAQIHMLAGWSQIVEVSISRRMLFIDDHSQTLFEVLDASLGASSSPDCSLKMAVILTQVALTCLAKLRDERYLCPGGVDSDNVTCLDVILVKQLPSGACQSILFKLMMAILRSESSELLRRRQYALLLSYFQYCRSILDPNVPASVLLLQEEHDGEDDMDLQKIDREQAELAQANFSILKKEAQAILDVVTRDSIQGNEAGRAISLYVLDAFISIDQDRFFLGQLQSRGFIRTCLVDISNFCYQDGGRSFNSLQKFCTLEAKLALLLRISYNYKKLGSQVLLSMGAFEHLSSCRVIGFQMKGSFRRTETKVGSDLAVEIDPDRLLLTPILRLVSCLTSLVDLSDFFEVKNKVVREVVDFIKGHQSLFDLILREDVLEADELTLEQVNLVVSILSKVWPYEENDDYGFVQALFGVMRVLFTLDFDSWNHVHSSGSLENQKKSELTMLRLCFTLSCYLYYLVIKKSLRLQVSDTHGAFGEAGGQPQPTLFLLVGLLNSTTSLMERAAEEKSLYLTKIQDINELSRQEVDEIINMCMREDCITSFDNIRKRRYIAMVQMCHLAGNRDQLITLLLKLAEHALSILLIHIQDDKAVSGGDLSLLSGELLPTLERLEQLRQDKMGPSLKMFQRSVSVLKEFTVRNLAL